ncbi:MAG TPA: hemerythrin domain-containing protein [Actinomycetota bacterium]|nr:hemerythrin domain-containing protein [Actinomycetota bacterium]
MGPTEPIEEFTRIFREEHRRVRDGLLDLAEAFRARDRSRAQALLRDVAELTGPHFRYEEESLYPALVRIFGAAYVEKLLADHDRAIAAARRLTELAGADELREEDVEEATELVRQVLPHVSDCEGLSLMVERFEEETVRSILDARARALDEGLDLMRWAEEVRGRP